MNDIQNMQAGRELDTLDFGDYVEIEQKRYNAPNEMYLYKVIGKLSSNHYMHVPVRAMDSEYPHEEVVPVLACICCGVDETKVQNFRLVDVRPRSIRRE